MTVYTTEITSDEIPSDNPIHQRLLQAYHLAVPFVKGALLELGCGEGRGIDLIAPQANSYTAIDKIGDIVQKLAEKYPDHDFRQGHFPPLPYASDAFDTIVSFQVIEHIKDDHLFLQEIHRILKPGGTALLTTPNSKMTLTRNPWHIREYTADELEGMARKYFTDVEMRGVAGNERVMTYYEQNKASVARITRYDIFNLQYRLPSALLRVPYDLLNRMNRNKLNSENSGLVSQIKAADYLLKDKNDDNLDLFLIVKK